MDKSRRKSKEWWSEREGEGFLQRGQSRKARLESAAARGWLKERQFLRKDDGDEEEINFRKNRK